MQRVGRPTDHHFCLSLDNFSERKGDPACKPVVQEEHEQRLLRTAVTYAGWSQKIA